ncbi:MAG: amidohydrolase family protein [Cyclobacteriaceae bacterium]|nr:amidohydrolase family protein [Cyclobacteriaceae bacterium]
MILLSVLTTSLGAQNFFPENGVHDQRNTTFVLKNAKIILSATQHLEKGSIIYRDGKILEVGADLKIPEKAVVYDLEGFTVYPSFIDLFSHYGISASKSVRSRGPVYENPDGRAAYRNAAIKAEFSSKETFEHQQDSAKKYLENGFGAVLTHSSDGIARGFGSVVLIGEENPSRSLLKPDGFAAYSFLKGSSTMTYPSSLMGSMALLRQSLYDAAWYAGQSEYVDFGLDALNRQAKLPKVFHADDKLTVLRAAKLGREFGYDFILTASGKEYQQIEELKKVNARLILPLNYPKAYDVEDPDDALVVSIEDMKHWEYAPHNARLLSENGLSFTFTAKGLPKGKSFLEALRETVAAGLSKEEALRALTSRPADWLGMSTELGSIKKGAFANLLISTGDLLEEDDALIVSNINRGNIHSFVPMAQLAAVGSYEGAWDEDTFKLKVSRKDKKFNVSLQGSDSTQWKGKGEITALGHISYSFKKDEKTYRMQGRLNADRNYELSIEDLQSGGRIQITAARLETGDQAESSSQEKETEDEEDKNDKLGEIWHPFMAYGKAERPKAETILIKNATVWTNEEAGILQATDVLVRGGKIAQIGKDLNATADRTIDGKNKHLTTGIIDEHSHIAISRGVNESASSLTSEVTIEDVVNPDDVNIYRQLAGGVTAAQLLHGSANSVGGRSALIKLKYGSPASEMLIPNAPKFIKFALGENVKQSNWGESNTTRFPQTRMGVEQIFYDGFMRAKEYEAEWKKYQSLSAKQRATAQAPRRDLRLEALVEILNNERFISCHSYVQSEINMLMQVADSMGFTVNTFTHILEGYKLADKMASHGAGGSTFSDWWVYKMEVQEAIPYNAGLMASQGVTVAINSDDAEMGRRLNQEAAKSIKYTEMPEEEAWKMVTLNAAKLLKLDDRMGSIKVGKEADLVLWNENPLSVYASPDYTMIEGKIYFSKEEDAKLREKIKQERIRLTEMMLKEKMKGKPTQKGKKKEQKIWHCSDRGGLEMVHMHDHLHDH